MRVSLVTNVPDQPVAWRIKGIVERNGQFNRAQRRAGVSTNARHSFQDVLTNFVGNELQLLQRKSPQISRRVYILKKMHLRGIVACSFRFLLLTNLLR